MNASTAKTIDELLKLDPYERKQIAIVLIASTLGKAGRDDAIDVASNIIGFPTESN